MTKLSLIALVALSACTSAPETLEQSDLVGHWRGTASNGYTFEWQFTPEGAFTRSIVGSSGNFVMGQGTYSVAATLTLQGTFYGEEGDGYRARIEVPAYASSTGMCEVALTAEGNHGVVGTWTSTVTSQSLDASDTPIGEPQITTETMDLRSDGTVVDMAGDIGDSGTYTQNANQITTTFPHGSVASVRTYTFVDDRALCDPLYTLARG